MVATSSRPRRARSRMPLIVLAVALTVALLGQSLPPQAGAAGGPAARVKDILAPPATSPMIGRAERLTVAGDQLFFVGYDYRNGRELWVSDGTTAGTRLVKDIYPGPFGSQPGVYEPVAIGRTLFFTADDGSSGRELWKSDGTAAGTTLVKDVFSGPGGSDIRSLAAFQGALYFVAEDAAHGPGLWRSDGTAAGTTLVKEIYPTASSLGTSMINELTPAGATLFFMADDGVHGRELWKSDGTAEGTVLVKDIVPGASESLPDNLTAVGDTLFFGTIMLNQLWKSDGTAEGTVPLASVTAQDLTVIGGRVFFRGIEGQSGAELWTSDGTPAGTRMVADLAPGAPGSYPGNFAALDGALYFFTFTPALALWRSDGTPEGTTQVAPFSNSGYTPEGLTAALGRLFFTLGTSETGWELWESDGTGAGTRLFYEIVPGTASSSPGEYTPFAGQLFFTAFQRGRDLWATDGTAGGTAMVAEIDPFGHLGSQPEQMTAMGSRLLFAASDGAAIPKLWASDGTTAGTTLITTTIPYRLAVAGGAAYFTGNDGQQSQIWRTDGTPAGTVPVSITAQVVSSGPLLATGDRVLYTDVNNPFGKVDLWLSDATGEAMQPFATIPGTRHPTGEADIQDVETVDGAVVLILNRGEGGELWRADGTPSGAVRLTMAHAQGQLAQAGGRLFFAAYDAAGAELWTSDGTVTGTLRLADLNPGSAESYPHNFTAAGDRVYFSANDGAHGDELWVSDGTAAGTRMVLDAVPGPAGSEPSLGVAAGDGIYYSAQDLEHGRELWKSDGTAAGTAMVRDIMPGLGGSLPQAFQAVPDGIVFAASDGASGLELWRSAGTSGSTVLVQDIAPGPMNSNPQSLIVAGDRLFFTAEGEGDGRELWSAPLAELFTPSPPPPPPPPALSLNHDRGRPGSAFLVTGAGFAPGVALTLRVKGVALGSVTSDGSGAFTALLRTAPRSPAGEYSVLVTPEGSTAGALAATAAYALDPAAPLREAPAAPVTFETLVPADLETLQLRVYLPSVAR